MALRKPLFDSSTISQAHVAVYQEASQSPDLCFIYQAKVLLGLHHLLDTQRHIRFAFVPDTGDHYLVSLSDPSDPLTISTLLYREETLSLRERTLPHPPNDQLRRLRSIAAITGVVAQRLLPQLVNRLSAALHIVGGERITEIYQIFRPELLQKEMLATHWPEFKVYSARSHEIHTKPIAALYVSKTRPSLKTKRPRESVPVKRPRLQPAEEEEEDEHASTLPPAPAPTSSHDPEEASWDYDEIGLNLEEYLDSMPTPTFDFSLEFATGVTPTMPPAMPEQPAPAEQPSVITTAPAKPVSRKLMDPPYPQPAPSPPSPSLAATSSSSTPVPVNFSSPVLVHLLKMHYPTLVGLSPKQLDDYVARLAFLREVPKEAVELVHLALSM